MFKFRPYQWSIIDKACDLLQKHRFVYLAMEVRTGKTLTSLGIAQSLGMKNVLFITKKKAIYSILDDYDLMNPSFSLEVINYESIHRLEITSCDLVILDEAHALGAFPKPSKRAKQVADFISKFSPYVILMSGTPTPESYSQMYHQVYGIPTNPFRVHKNFYSFAKEYVDIRQKRINSMYVNDYHAGRQSIIDSMKPMTISFSQKDAGFINEVEEHVLYVEMDRQTYMLADKLRSRLVVEGNSEVILGDTPVKLMQKLHQLYSGTIKFESGNSMVLDTKKAEFIKEYFDGKKIGIYYKFREELNAIRQVFGKENLTDDPSVFEDTDCKVIALQIVSGREVYPYGKQMPLCITTSTSLRQAIGSQGIG